MLEKIKKIINSFILWAWRKNHACCGNLTWSVKLEHGWTGNLCYLSGYSLWNTTPSIKVPFTVCSYCLRSEKDEHNVIFKLTVTILSCQMNKQKRNTQQSHLVQAVASIYSDTHRTRVFVDKEILYVGRLLQAGRSMVKTFYHVNERLRVKDVENSFKRNREWEWEWDEWKKFFTSILSHSSPSTRL